MAIPGMDVYGWKRLQATNAYNAAKLKLGRRRQDVLSRYGYAADFDDQGHATNVRVDPNAVGGEYQTMMRSHAAELDQADEASVERGISGAGLGAQAGMATRIAQAVQQGRFAQEVSGAFAGLGEESADLERDYTRGMGDIDYDAAQAAQEAGDFTPVAPDDSDEDPATATTATGIPGKPGPAGKVMWAGRWMTRQQLAHELAKQGVDPKTWAKRHPAAAKKLKLPKPKGKK